MYRYLGLDISLSSTGLAVIDMKKNGLKLVDTKCIPTTSKEPRGERLAVIEAETLLFIRANKPFDAVIREKFASPNPKTSEAIFGAWGAVDRALSFYGLEVSCGLAQTSIKKILTGNGRCDKTEVTKVIKEILKLPPNHKFETNDESDAIAVILSWLKKEKKI